LICVEVLNAHFAGNLGQECVLRDLRAVLSELRWPLCVYQVGYAGLPHWIFQTHDWDTSMYLQGVLFIKLFNTGYSRL
jgi:hypothetical protein